jgi:hypothetical protein
MSLMYSGEIEGTTISLRAELQYLHDICRCITAKDGVGEPCSDVNCVRCRLKPLIAQLAEPAPEAAMPGYN